MQEWVLGAPSFSHDGETKRIAALSIFWRPAIRDDNLYKIENCTAKIIAGKKLKTELC